MNLPAATVNTVIHDRTPTVATAIDLGDPSALLALVAAGQDYLPDGRKITPTMISAAKELLPYFKARLATTTKKGGPTRPLPELTDDELRQIIADEIEAALSGGRTPGPETGEEGLHDVV